MCLLYTAYLFFAIFSYRSKVINYSTFTLLYGKFKWNNFVVYKVSADFLKAREGLDLRGIK